MCASHLSARRSAVIVTAAREGERTGEGDKREGEREQMDDRASLALVLPPPPPLRSSGLRVSLQGKGEDAWGVQEEENKMRDGGGTERRVKVDWL